MKVQFTLDNLRIGGVPRNVIRLIGSLSAAITDYRLCVLHRVVDSIPGYDALEASRLDLVPEGGRLTQFNHLQTCLRRYSPDVVSTHGYVSQFYVACSRKSRGNRVPCVAFMHGMPVVRKLRSVLYWFLYKWSLTEADLIVCVSKDTRQRMEKAGFGNEKLLVIPNCIPHSSEVATVVRSRDTSKPLTIGYLGRLAPGKRIAALISATRWAIDQGFDVELLVAGDGELLEGSKRQVRSLGLESRVQFLGYIDKPMEFLSRVHCLALLSDSEGMPMSLLEAAAAGVPVLANRAGGIPEIVVNGFNGLLTESINPAEVGAAIAQIARNEGLRQRLASNQLSLARTRFSRETRAASVVEAYRTAIGVSTKRGGERLRGSDSAGHPEKCLFATSSTRSRTR